MRRPFLYHSYITDLYIPMVLALLLQGLGIVLNSTLTPGT